MTTGRKGANCAADRTVRTKPEQRTTALPYDDFVRRLRNLTGPGETVTQSGGAQSSSALSRESRSTRSLDQNYWRWTADRWDREMTTPNTTFWRRGLH